MTSSPHLPPVFVLGVDRSGTSLVSDLLVRWGVHPGAAEMLGEANEGNPQGYWEYRPMQDFNSHLQNSSEISVWDPDIRPILRSRAADPATRARAYELAAGMEIDGRPWFWKEPEVVLTLPFWSRIFADAIYVVTLRNPRDSAASYEKMFLTSELREQIRLEGYFYLRWQYFMLSILEHLRDHPRKHLVVYEDLVASPLTECERLCAFLDGIYGRERNPGAVDQGSAPGARAARMAEAVSPTLWRHRAEQPFAASPASTPEQQELFSYLLARSKNADFTDFEAERYPLPSFFAEYMTNIDTLGWLLKNL